MRGPGFATKAFGTQFGRLSDSSRTLLGRLPDAPRTPPGRLPIAFRTLPGRYSDASRTLSGRLPDGSQSPFGRLPDAPRTPPGRSPDASRTASFRASVFSKFRPLKTKRFSEKRKEENDQKKHPPHSRLFVSNRIGRMVMRIPISTRNVQFSKDQFLDTLLQSRTSLDRAILRRRSLLGIRVFRYSSRVHKISVSKCNFCLGTRL